MKTKTGRYLEVVCAKKVGKIAYSKLLTEDYFSSSMHRHWEANSMVADALKKTYNCKTCKYRYRCVTEKGNLLFIDE